MGYALGTLRGAMPPGRASTRHVSSNTVCFNPPWASAQTQHRRRTSPVGGRRPHVPPQEPAPGLKNTPQSPNRWEMVELASLRAVPDTCPQQRWSTVLLQSLRLAGKGLPGSPGDKSCLGGIHHVQIRRTPRGIQPGWLRLLSGSGQDQATGPWCSQLGHYPLSLGGKDANVSGQGRSSPDVFAPAAEGCFPASLSLAAPGEAPLPAQATSDRESLTRR